MSSATFRIKVCGVTSAADAAMCVLAGCDALGLNFYPGSSRHVTLDQACDIVEVIPSAVVKVGVFVNASMDDIMGSVERLGLDLVQLHGDETPEFVAELMADSIPVLRAFRCGSDLAPVANYLQRCRELDAMPERVLLDSRQPGAYGGTGVAADWPAIAAARAQLAGIPFILAGGLTAANVADAIAIVQPSAVDTASGVESSPGKKSRELVRAFVAAARIAFSSRGSS